MIDRAALQWFKETFGAEIASAVAGSPFTVDLLVAIGAQETGEIWAPLRTRLGVAELLEICVGDVLDADKGRSAFPRTRDELIAQPRGVEMFGIARDALASMARFVPGYAASAKRPNKFCHGYGIFQYDLQFFRVDPDYFLERRWREFRFTLAKCLGELRAAAQRAGFAGRAQLTELERVGVAIAYNAGRYRPERGLKQGFKDGTGRFYGENIFDYQRLSQTIDVPAAAATVQAPAAGVAPVRTPTPLDSSGRFLEVNVESSQLRVRREPRIDRNRPSSNVVAHLPDGQRVRWLSGKRGAEFLEIETSLGGAHVRGFAASKFLVATRDVTPILVTTPAAAPPQTGAVAVWTPRKSGSMTTRRAPADALSLNEPSQPSRGGTTPQELRESLWRIVDWLAVDRVAHARYRPRDGLTFCNIYAHDYCALAGVYLPRTWWMQDALERLARGEAVAPRLGATISEQRANDLFRWLAAFGPRFGWRRTASLDSLQSEANLGAVALIVARRKDDGRSGHVVLVVPEKEADHARRDASGHVLAPLQSQAGARNFRFGTGVANWWNGEQFAESAFWIHA